MKNKFSALLASAAIATGAIATLAAAPAHALTANCSVNDVTANGFGSATRCAGEIELNSSDWAENNDVTSGGNPLLGRLNTLLGTNYDWSFVAKDESGGANSPTNGFDGRTNTQSGNWSFAAGLTGPFAISLKGGDGFSVYLFDNVQQLITSGTWNTLGLNNPGRQQPNLSHISLFRAQGGTPPTQSVPEPASLFGLGLVATGMVMARRRRNFANN